MSHSAWEEYQLRVDSGEAGSGDVPDDPEQIPAEVTRNLYAALCKAHGYVAAIARGEQPAITTSGKAVARDRLEFIDGALAEAGDYIGRGSL